MSTVSFDDNIFNDQSNILSTQEKPENILSTQEKPENILSTQKTQENILSTQEKPENILSTQEKPENILSTQDTQEEAKVCLITNEPLTNHYVTLKCKHTFNYEPLLFDIIAYKKIYLSTNLNINHIKCPYCRQIQITKIPYYYGYKKIIGVNYNPLDVSFCQIILKSGKRKGDPCNTKCFNQTYCRKHTKKEN
jgi:hypothetical protein